MFNNTGIGFAASAPAALLLILAACAMACGGGSGGGGGAGAVIAPPGLEASFAGSDSAATEDLVRTSGNSTSDLVTVGVLIGGPTTSTDLYSFAFDLTLGDATVAEYVAGSASTGPALTPDGGQTLQVLATQQGNRVTVGVTKLGGGSGNGVSGAGETAIVELTFRLLREGSTTLTIEGSPGSDPAALDPTGGVINSVIFDAAPAVLMGR